MTGPRAARPSLRPIAGTWAAGLGLVLLAAGIVGFFPDPVIGEPGRIFATAAPLNAAHAVLGVVALSIAWGLDEDGRADAVLGFGILLLLLAGAEAAGDGPFGLLPGPTNVLVREATAALGALTVVMGILAGPPALAAARMGRLRPDGAGGTVGRAGGAVEGSRNYRAVREPGSRGR